MPFYLATFQYHDANDKVQTFCIALPAVAAADEYDARTKAATAFQKACEYMPVIFGKPATYFPSRIRLVNEAPGGCLTTDEFGQLWPDDSYCPDDGE